MASLSSRDLLAFPAGDNSTDTILNGVHFNLTTLYHWDYTYYSNSTLSNGSSCFLLFPPYTPHLLQNGTFLNSTSCYSPVRPMDTRSKLGLFFACLFALSIAATHFNSHKHGINFLPREKRFRVLERRLPWLWMLAVAACACLSGFMTVDIDRYYLPEMPLVLSNIFWFLMVATTMCVVFENVRCWGGWKKRQRFDEGYLSPQQDDRGEKVEFFLPFVFYIGVFLNVLLNLLRNWGDIELQRDPEQTRLIAMPAATSIPSKIAGLFLLTSWVTTAFFLHNFNKYYKHLSQNNERVPFKFLISLALSLLMIGYEAATSFDFSVSPLNNNTDLGIMYCFGWVPIALIITIYEIAGFMDTNEDLELIRLRRVRGTELQERVGNSRSRSQGEEEERYVHEGESFSGLGDARMRANRRES